MFALWDFLFGTQCQDFDSYPKTGVDDKNIPHPENATLTAALKVFGRMLTYPVISLHQRSKLQRPL
jgi:hypothetical protein